MRKYNRYLRFFAEDPKNKIQLAPEDLNLITILRIYYDQCRGKKVPTDAEAMLHILDNFCKATSDDGVIWNHDYNSEQLNYYFREGEILKKTHTL